MKKKITLDQSFLRILYLRYKNFLLPSILAIIALIIIIKILLPQISLFLELKTKTKESEKKVAILRSNYNFISNLNEYNVNSDLDLVSSSLPTEKDFSAILNSISVSSNNSGVVLSDYSFTVGNLSLESAEVKTDSFVQINLEASGDTFSLINFLFELSTKLPLSESVSLKLGSSKSLVTVYFYQKPFYKIPFDLFSPIRQRSKEELEILEKLKQFKESEGKIGSFEEEVSLEELPLEESL